ncbi:MAG TPA: tetratricopeptide repeat protein, partial [Pyrinomonadaceae bacterium]|nr:tetratricopeptide repeat protein [Pyrinomonadaceae bacterium]
ISPAEIDQTVPKGANDIVNKCLEIQRERRYQSVTELLGDLESFDPAKKVGTAERARTRFKKFARYRNWTAIAALVLLALTVALLIRNRSNAPTQPVQHAPETVLIADFSNHTGNPIFDGTLEPVVKLGLEGAGFITAYDRTQLKGLGAKPITGKLDDTTAGQVAVSVGVGVVVSGSLEQQGSGFLVRMKATRAVSGNTITTVEDNASNKDQVMFVAGKLVSSIRKSLGDETPEASQRFALETFTNASLEAVHDYVTATQALSQGKYEEALRGYQKVVDIDENFAMAYRNMALASRNLRQYQESEKYIKLALGHIDHLTARERFHTRASNYAVVGNYQKCIEEYRDLITNYPSDTQAHNNFAYCATQLRDLKTGLDQVRAAATIFPKRATYRLNISLYSSYGTNFESGEQEAHATQDLDPNHPKGFIALAFAQLGQNKPAEAIETYQKLEKLNDVGASYAAAGLADVALYQGRFGEASQILEKAADVDLSHKFPDEAATKLVVLAYSRLLRGEKSAAVAAAQRAMNTSNIVKVRFLAGRVLAAAGETARAKKAAADLAAETLAEPQSYAMLIEGEIALNSGDARGAIKSFTEANKLLDTWISRFDLGRSYLADKQFTEADSEFDRCIQRRGEALALFLDESPTYGFFPAVYYYQGQVREGMKSSGFAESYRKYLAIRATNEDSLASDARKHANQ